MQIAQVIAGYSLGEADILRRAMGKKKQEEMEKQRQRFLDGAAKKGFSQKKADRLFDQMAKFAEYGFNKSHSAAYAYLAYVTAYLKAHYPVEFMSALLTSETGNTAKVVKYINECRDRGIRVLPPDVNASGMNFTPAGDSIRFGLGAIKSLGASSVQAIVSAREQNGKFATIEDFCEQVDAGAINRRVIENLIKSGAMDSLEGNRGQLFAMIDPAIESGQRASRDRASGQAGLFAGFVEEHKSRQPLPAVPDWTPKDKLDGEKETIGFYVTGHPLDEYRDKVAALQSHDSSSLEGLNRGEAVAICGLIAGVQRKRNKEGKLWASFQIEDWYGAAECLCFASSYEQLQAELVEDAAVLVRGQALPEENAPARISVKDMVPLAKARVALPRLISIRVGLSGTNGADKAAALTDLFGRKPGEAEVRLRLEKPRDFSVILDVTVRVRPDKEFCAEVERICGPQSMEVLAD